MGLCLIWANLGLFECLELGSEIDSIGDAGGGGGFTGGNSLIRLESFVSPPSYG